MAVTVKLVVMILEDDMNLKKLEEQLEGVVKSNIKEEKEKFLQFLRENSIYRKFKQEIEKCHDFESYINECLRETGPNDFFQGFAWVDTEDGFEFWNSLDTEWQNIYYGRKQ